MALNKSLIYIIVGALCIQFLMFIPLGFIFIYAPLEIQNFALMLMFVNGAGISLGASTLNFVILIELRSVIKNGKENKMP